MQDAQIYTLVALLVYALIMIVIGCISYGKSKTLDGFLIGGRKIGAWATAFAYGTTYFSAVVFVGYDTVQFAETYKASVDTMIYTHGITRYTADAVIDKLRAK